MTDQSHELLFPIAGPSEEEDEDNGLESSDAGEEEGLESFIVSSIDYYPHLSELNDVSPAPPRRSFSNGAGLSAYLPSLGSSSSSSSLDLKSLRQQSRCAVMLQFFKSCCCFACLSSPSDFFPTQAQLEIWSSIAISFLHCFSQAIVFPTLWQYAQYDLSNHNNTTNPSSLRSPSSLSPSTEAASFLPPTPTFISTITHPTLPPSSSAQDLSSTPTSLSSAVFLAAMLSLFSFAHILFSPLACATAHRFSFKLVFLLCILLGLSADVLYLASSALVPSFLLLARFVAGIASSIQPVAQACISEFAHPSLRPTLLGRFAISSLLALALGPILGAILDLLFFHLSSSSAPIPFFYLSLGSLFTFTITPLTLPVLVSFFIGCIALLVCLSCSSFRLTTLVIRSLHYSSFSKAEFPITLSGIDISGWPGLKWLRRRITAVMLIIQFYLSSHLAALEPVLLLFPDHFPDFAMYDRQLLFALVSALALLSLFICVSLRRRVKSPHTQPLLCIFALAVLAISSAIAIDAAQLSLARFLTSAILFGISFPIAFIELTSLYTLVLGQRFHPLGHPMILWAIVTGLAKVFSPWWSTVFYTLIHDQPLIFYAITTVGSVVSIGLMALIYRPIVDRIMINNIVETSEIVNDPNLESPQNVN